MDYEVNTKKRKRSTSVGTAGNTSSASASASGGEYEVFLSFRGEDTRKGFTDFLYNYLVDAGIRTFRDNEELHVGEEIGPELLKAIKESKISIPIFSKNYASSKWCLRELAQIVECQTTMGQKIFPIFYDVEPSVVKHQTGSYEKAFRRHKKRFNEETVQGWKEALTAVVNLKGLELEKETDGHQGEFAKMVFEKVLSELKKNDMVVTENLVGIDHHIEKMMEFLNVDSNEVQIVGIHGMGGIGKTTIAKVIYNQLSERFECCCFLEDVRETLKQHKGLANLQNQLISMILKGKCPNIVDVNDGINTIKDTVCRKKVLIVLDDVDEKSQFDKLAGKRDWYVSGSRIILTTRNEEVLIGLEVDKTYKPSLMELDHSLQLFSKHAFRRNSPREDYVTLSREVVSTAAGLPLALEIIGSLLFRKEKAVWEDTLMKLKEIPHEDVRKKLIISYDALDGQTREIFLDIACFFIGEDKINPSYMWNDCKFYPTSGINVLVLKSLVKIGDDNTLRMHDQLRDLGREIVRKENFQEPGERSRLWRREEALDMLKSRMGTKKVVALSLDIPWEERDHYCFTNKEFEQLPKLRFLQVDYADLAGDFENLLSNLRWLRWQGCPGNFMPTNFYLKNLVILDLSESNITDDWEGWSQIKMATKLKVLDLLGCSHLTRTPDLSTFATLEILILTSCYRLGQIGPSIGNLINLRVLDISETGITKLPDAIGNFRKLEEIKASYCDYLQGEIPSNIGRLSSLRILRLNSTKICSLPVEIVALSRLEHLEIEHCNMLKCISGLPSSLLKLCLTGCESVERLPDLSNLENLSELRLGGCYGLMEIQGLGKLELLTSLDVSWCRKLTKLDGLPSSLFKLCLTGCESLERLPDLSNLKKLSELMLDHCPELMEIQGLGKLELLTSLDLSWCRKLTKLDGLPSNLLKLCLTGCESVERLPDLSNLENLSELILGGCYGLMEIQGLGKLKLLTSLDTYGCRKLTKLDGFPSSLLKLCLTGCESVERLPDLSNLKNLSELRLDGCHGLMEIQGLGKLELLTRLDVSRCRKLTKLDGLPLSFFKLCLTGCESVERLPDLSNLKNLSELILDGCHELMEIQGLGKLELLTSLDVSRCGKLTKLDGLPSSLLKLCLSFCESVERLPNLSNLKNLSELRLHGCYGLMEIQGLGKLELLTSLDVSWCGKLTKLDGLPSSLLKLCLSCCESVERLPDLSNLENLLELRLDGCYGLMEIQGLGKLELLTSLDGSRCGKLTKLDGLPSSLLKLCFSCKSVERLPDLSNLENLSELRLYDCHELMEIQGLGKLELLKRLDVSQCGKLTKLDGLPSSLLKLCLAGCEAVERLPDLSNLENLSELRLYGCYGLMEIQGLGKLKLLTSLDASRCRKLTKLDGLPSSLLKLCLTGCESVVRLPDLSNLENLSELRLGGCYGLMEIQGLGKLELLTSLDVSRCRKLTKLDGLPSSLFKLCITGCESVERLPDLSNLENLSELMLDGCNGLMEILGLGKLELLTSLNVSWCGKLTKLDGLEQLESLKYLNTSNCESVERVPDLSNLKKLQTLITENCEKLIKIQGLDRLESLIHLDVSGCKSLELKICGCENLTRIWGLGDLKSLTSLDISGCQSIEKLPHLANTNILKDLSDQRFWRL